LSVVITLLVTARLALPSRGLAVRDRRATSPTSGSGTATPSKRST